MRRKPWRRENQRGAALVSESNGGIKGRNKQRGSKMAASITKRRQWRWRMVAGSSSCMYGGVAVNQRSNISQWREKLEK